MEEEAPEWPIAEGEEEAFARMQHVASEAHAEGVDLTLPPGARAAAPTDAGPLPLAEQGLAPPPLPTPTPESFCQGYPE
eukprot:8064909-Lingulodinium_polyedra.AAC.1